VIPDAVRTDLERLIGKARWFGGKGRAFRVADVRRAGEVPGPLRVTVDLARVVYDDGGEELYQLPLVHRDEQVHRLDHALVGVWDGSHVYDAVHDREAMAQWLSSFVRGEQGPDAGSDLLFHRLPGHDLDLASPSSLFGGEQSNSSVAFGEDSLLKVFRKVTPGINPDIQVHHVLTEAGSDHVAALYGWVDLVDEQSDSVIQLAMLQQFLRTASDGWDLARASVRNLYAEADLHADEVGGDFASEAARLGLALAETHATLAAWFPVERWGPQELGALCRRMHDRLDDAVGIVPDLTEHADALRDAFDAVAELPEVTAQRVHGDLHLGQTLRTVRGWKLVDFEGEPARPLHERLLPDPVWRDVAGMQRSFWYAAAVVEREVGEGDPETTAQLDWRAAEWAERNRGAFVSAYAGRELTRDERVLLDAYEVDKAVYECVYEARNRPDWLSIPLESVARLAEAAGEGAAE